jgi:hypothetical protein
MKVDQARAELDATRASYDAVGCRAHSCIDCPVLTKCTKACGRLVEQQKEITTTIGQITSLSLTDTTLDSKLTSTKNNVILTEIVCQK